MSGDPYIRENDELRAEIARLRSHLDDTGYPLGEVDALIKDNAKLRAALEALLERLSAIDYRFAGKLPFLLSKLDEVEEARKAVAKATPGDGTA